MFLELGSFFPMDDGPRGGNSGSLMEKMHNGVPTSVGAKLLAAEWWETCETPSGSAFKWSALGLRRTMLLRLIIEQFDLAEGASAPARFTIVCRTQPEPQAHGRPGNPFHGFWISCLDEVGLDGDNHSLSTFVQLIVAGSELTQQRFSSHEMSVSPPDQAPTSPCSDETNFSCR